MPVSFFCLLADHHINAIPCSPAVIRNDFITERIEIRYITHQIFKIIRRYLYDIAVFQGIYIVCGRFACCKAYLVTDPLIIG